MVPNFSRGWAGSIERWFSLPFKSGILFWLGGLVAWLYYNNTNYTYVWEWPMDKNAVEISRLIFILLMASTMIAGIFKRFDMVVIRFLEGYYWSGWRANLLKYLQNQQIARIEARFQILAQKYDKGLPPLTSK